MTLTRKRRTRLARVHISAILVRESPGEIEAVVGYLMRRVPSFELLLENGDGSLRRLAWYHRRERIPSEPGPVIPSGARVVRIHSPYSIAAIETALRHA